MPDRRDAEERTLRQAFRQANHDLNSEPESAASILQSVKEQELQFEQLTRELEAERQSVANQLERCKLGSETASMSSISSTDESFHWRPPQQHAPEDDESDADSKMSGSQLVDSCLKVLQERGVMDTHDDPMEGMKDAMPHPDRYAPERSYNGGGNGEAPVHTSHQSLHSVNSSHSNPHPGGVTTSQPESVTVTKVIHTRTVTEVTPRHHPTDNYYDPYRGDNTSNRGTPRHMDPPPPQSNYSDPYEGRNPYEAPETLPDEDPGPAVYRNPSTDTSDYYHNPTPPREPEPNYSRQDYHNPYTPSREYSNYNGQPPTDNYAPVSYMEDPGTPVMRAPLAEPETPGSMGSLRAHTPSLDSTHRADPMAWRDPDLPELIEMLREPHPPVQANAAAYLQHLCYGDDPVKAKIRSLGGIPELVQLLDHPSPDVHRNAAGALRNLAYGKANDENKSAINNANGIPALVRLLRKTPDTEVQELVTGVLWNLSSHPPLKQAVIDDALAVLTNRIIIPHSGWEASPDADSKPRDIQWSVVFRNATGCLRNVSSAGPDARRKMRECDGLVDALLHVLQTAIGKNDMDNKSVENCMCVLRNLSFRLPKEVPSAQRYELAEPPKSSQPPPKKKPTSCFGSGKKKSEDSGIKQWDGTGPIPQRAEPARGQELLWQPEVVRPYLSLLLECSNHDTLEAAAGALQNLSAGNNKWAAYVRAMVRKDKGLPVLVELIRMDNDRVVRAVATALRNLSLDNRNKELIGKYAMRDLVYRLPGGDSAPKTSEPTMVAILHTLHEVISKNMENAKSLRDAGGIERLVTINKNRDKYSPEVVRAARQVLATLWSFKDLRPVFKKDGWNASHFPPARVAAHPPGSTMARGASPGAGLEYDDTTLPAAGTQANSNAYSTLPDDKAAGRRQLDFSQDNGTRNTGADKSRGGEEIPMTDLTPGYATVERDTRPEQNFQPPVGGVPVFGTPNQQNPEPLYAKQVNKDKSRAQDYGYVDDPDPRSFQLEDPDPQKPTDSWV
ncbi:catenin delta-2-like isoform X1 [Branchiostoma floridae x Branchiostoma belcheri]